MSNQVSQRRLKGFRFPRPIISYAIWAEHRFVLSLRDIEDLLAERGVIVSYESIRVWCQRFGTQIAAKIRRDRPVPADKWHLDEVVISIRGRKHCLWRAVDANGDVLEILMQSRRNAHAAKRFLMKLMKRLGVPRVLVTDKLRMTPIKGYATRRLLGNAHQVVTALRKQGLTAWRLDGGLCRMA
jgi:putative transposase